MNVPIFHDGDRAGVFAQRYDSGGNPLGGEFQVNSYTTGYQGNPEIAMYPDGRFVVVWSGSGPDAGRVFARRYDATGSAQGLEFRVDGEGTAVLGDPAVGVDTAGNFVVTWTSGHLGIDGKDGNGRDILARRFDSAGASLGSQFRVSEQRSGNQQAPDVAAADGGFVVVWESLENPPTKYEVQGRRFTGAGLAAGGDFPVNTYTFLTQASSHVSADSSGDFVVVWSSGADQDGSAFGVFGDRFIVPPAQLLAGKKLLIKNRVPDDPERNTATWTVRDEGIVAGGRGTPSNPRCNTDPPGTVRADIRFVSASSGQDTGTIDLPCEYWTALRERELASGVQVQGPAARRRTLQSGAHHEWPADQREVSRERIGRLPIRPYPGNRRGHRQRGADNRTYPLLYGVRRLQGQGRE